MLNHKHCWSDLHEDAETWWSDNGMICPEQSHLDHA